MIKKISLILTVILLFTSLASCGEEVIPDREYNAQEVVEAAKTLIEKSESLNKLLWGEGILYDVTNNLHASGYYYRADEFSLDNYGVETIADIEKQVRAVFSENYSNQIFASTVFSSASDVNGNLVYFARYQQKEDLGKPEYIQVYSKWEPFLFDSVTYDYTSVKDSGAKGERVYVEISCSVKDSESELVEKRSIRVALIEEKSGWRLDSPTNFEISKEDK